jgi:dolichol-phosphate mannosyltransferase
MKPKICIVIPCYGVKDEIFDVVNKINLDLLSKLIIVDDKCYQNSVKILKKKLKKNKKIIFIFSKKNLGVGGATLLGINRAIKEQMDYVVKIDGDGQHDYESVKKVLKKVERNKFDYIKGFRDVKITKTQGMPFSRLMGSFFLTIISKLITGNWLVRDITNGLVALRLKFFKKFDQKKIRKNYFFEQDLFFFVCLYKGIISEIKIRTIYKNETSNVRPLKVILPFIFYHLRNLTIKMNYLLRK